MTERELLEMAAKAAGIHLEWILGHPKEITTHWSGNYEEGEQACDWDWNPLTDDGDALRLAVKLNLDIRVDTCDEGVSVTVFGNYDDAPPSTQEAFEDYNSGLESTRRAITRAAAAIGSAM